MFGLVDRLVEHRVVETYVDLVKEQVEKLVADGLVDAQETLLN
jgi:hypothetical protein